MTIAKEHGGAAKGYKILADLKGQVASKFGKDVQNVELKYVLVVPSQQDAAVRWNMTKGMRPVTGEFFVLYIDFSQIPYEKLYSR